MFAGPQLCKSSQELSPGAHVRSRQRDIIFRRFFAVAALAIFLPFAIDARTPWTTSKFRGTPDAPPPYSVEPAFPGLRFEHAVLLVPAPGSDRLFVGEQGGMILAFANDPSVTKTDLVIDLRKHRADFSNLYGLAFHPRFAQNRQVFVCYTTKDGKPDGTRVSRFLASRADPPVIDPASETILLTFLSGGHNGGCLAFGPDGYLYISSGDAERPSPPDLLDTGQDVSDLLSSILRIDVDHDDSARKLSYRIPADNPFVNLPGARGEIWAYGFRNPWRMSFDRAKGDLWVGDVGWELWEMVDHVVKGGNYGWSVMEGRQPVRPDSRRGPTPILPPTVIHPHSEAASVTGGYVYHGTRLPDLQGMYIYGDFQSGKVWGLRFDGTKVTESRSLADTPLMLVSFGEDNAGEIYLLDYERTRQVYRLVPNASAKVNREFPRKLSESGLFASTKEHKPADGVVPYAINAAMWTDHATAERFLAIPGEGRVTETNGGLTVPNGSVLARTVSREMERGNPKTARRVETQVLHFEEKSWRPYTYIWNDEQTDAMLADPEGSIKPFTIRDKAAPGGARTVNHRIHSRAECTQCHNPWVGDKYASYGRQSASPLGFSLAQLDRDVAGTSQLARFERDGVIAGSTHHASVRLVDPYDDTADLNQRARSYLHVNCSHCHLVNAGGTATIQLGADIAPQDMRAFGARPTQGTFDIEDARIIRPGDPDGSVLLYRMAKLGGGRMPRLGSNEVDEKAVMLISRWIEQMPVGKEERAAIESLRSNPKDAIERLTATTRGAMALLRAIDRGELPEPARREAIAIAARHPKGEIRDLFERFLPESERIVRLGDSIDPKTILSLTGDAPRGRTVFQTRTGAQCKSCHKLENVGSDLGPDLAKIGAKYRRDELLTHILDPSRLIDPKYVTYVVATKDGRVLSGLLAEKTAESIMLKDARGQATRIPASDVEAMLPQARSLMPEQLLRDLTAQQAADLVEYLGTLR